MGIMDKIKRKRRDLERNREKRQEEQYQKDLLTLKKLGKQKKREGAKLKIRKKKRQINEMKQKEKGGGGISGILKNIGEGVSKADFGGMLEDSSNTSPPSPFDETLSKREKKCRQKEKEDLW